jgi:hypothetical protein
VDLVGLTRSVVTAVGECKVDERANGARGARGSRRLQGAGLREAKIRFAKNGPHTLLFSRSGFRPLAQAAQRRGNVTLISGDRLVSEPLAARG